MTDPPESSRGRAVITRVFRGLLERECCHFWDIERAGQALRAMG